MANKKGFIVDLDGTLFRGKERLPFAREFIEAVKSSDSKLLIMTNNTTRTPEDVAIHLKHMDILVNRDEVFTAALATVQYMNEQKKGNKVYCIGEHGLHTAIVEAGYEISEESADYVVQGLDRAFNYEKLTKAMVLVSNGADFVMSNPDLRLPMENGFMPASGAIGAAIQAATGIQPTVIGKPSTIIMNYALERLGLSSEDVWMVGDNVLTDIAAGKAASCNTALLLTGSSSRSDGDEAKPDFIGEHLREFAEFVGLA